MIARSFSIRGLQGSQVLGSLHHEFVQERLRGLRARQG